MPNSYDGEARGPSNRRIFVAGLVLWLAVSFAVVLMIAKSRGALDPFVRVTAELTNVGDGLPAKSDVKFRGVLVGFVDAVVPARDDRPNIVSLNLKPELAGGIPGTVTARVVPSNVFAVSSVQLVDNGADGAPLQSGEVVHEDRSLPTVLFQTTLNKLRSLLKAVGRDPDPNGVGWLTALGEAADGRGERLTQSGHDLNEIIGQLNTVVDGKPGPSTIAALSDAMSGLRRSAPELLDALEAGIRPMRTLAEQDSALKSFLFAAGRTVGTAGDAFDNHADQMIQIGSQLTPVVGVLADHHSNISLILANIQYLIQRVVDKVFNWDTNNIQARVAVSLTPTRTYVRADCPRYGDMLGPSCFTAPEVPTAPALSASLGSVNLPMPPGIPENRPNVAPPRNSVLPPSQGNQDGNNGPLPTADPAQPVAPAAAEDPDPGTAAVPNSYVVGGNVGPVGSQLEKDQLGAVLGGQPTAATEMLLAPLVRGTAMTVTSRSEASR